MKLLASQSGNLIIAPTVALTEYPLHEICIHTWYVPWFFLFPHIELRLMFHTLWTNSSCHGYHSLEFPVSWVIKFPAVILLYWFVSVTPYFLGLPCLRTFHRLLRSPQAFAFCTPVPGRIEGFSHSVWSSSKQSRVKPPQGLCEPRALQWIPDLLKSVLLEIPSLAEQPTPTPVQL